MSTIAQLRCESAYTLMRFGDPACVGFGAAKGNVFGEGEGEGYAPGGCFDWGQDRGVNPTYYHWSNSGCGHSLGVWLTCKSSYWGQ